MEFIVESHPSRVRGLKSDERFDELVEQMVAPFTGAWIEISGKAYTMDDLKGVAPFTGAWIEIAADILDAVRQRQVAPFTGAWIEMLHNQSPVMMTPCRTLHGCVD